MDTNRIRRALEHSRRGRANALAGLLIAALLIAQSVDARAQIEDESEPLFRVQRIELSLFGGYTLGDSYLELPAPLDPDRTNDTAADEILDFSGNPANVEAPSKEIEAGWNTGLMATFYLTPNFGMQMYGAYGQADAVLTGQRSLRNTTREEIDRTTLTVYQGGGSILYHIGRERKMPVRPYVTLGFGGIINQFDDTEDPTALYFRYGGGLTFPIGRGFRGLASFTTTLFSWDTDEVAFDETVQVPNFALGVTWRHDVPEDDDLDGVEGTGSVAPTGR